MLPLKLWILLGFALDFVNPQQPNGGLCLRNSACASNCCIFRSQISGACSENAIAGEVCGYVATADVPYPELMYSICDADRCSSQCCCSTQCCPTSLCTNLLGVEASECVHCQSGCCCQNNQCCPLIYCFRTLIEMLRLENSGSVVACTQCASGCCCDDRCCLPHYCQGSSVGYRCSRCETGCCCGEACCSVRFCEDGTYDIHGMLSSYYGIPARYIPFYVSVYGEGLFEAMTSATSLKSKNSTMSQKSRSHGRLRHMPVQRQDRLMPVRAGIAPQRYGLELRGRSCLDCTTGCCCSFGCCGQSYCREKGGLRTG